MEGLVSRGVISGVGTVYNTIIIPECPQ